MKNNITSKRMYLGLLLNSSPVQREKILRKFSVEDRRKIVALLDSMPVMSTKAVRNLRSEIIAIDGRKVVSEKPVCKISKDRSDFLIRSPMFTCKNEEQVTGYLKKLDETAISILDSYLERTDGR
ncbi:hypothetical protein ACOIWI_000515 [Vibrio vulnificus]|nr:hypothetical protein [Vibrio vulnificus]EJP4175462.1 hypothetical protein [Vibrio vulnificus]ELX4197054.1 hypothetical protein [Vibrio vulnificus]